MKITTSSVWKDPMGMCSCACKHAHIQVDKVSSEDENSKQIKYGKFFLTQCMSKMLHSLFIKANRSGKNPLMFLIMIFYLIWCFNPSAKETLML